MHLVALAPLTELLELYFALNFLFVLAGPVIYTLTVLAGEFYESIL